MFDDFGIQKMIADPRCKVQLPRNCVGEFSGEDGHEGHVYRRQNNPGEQFPNGAWRMPASVGPYDVVTEWEVEAESGRDFQLKITERA